MKRFPLLVLTLASLLFAGIMPRSAFAATNLARTCFDPAALTYFFGDVGNCPDNLQGWIAPHPDTPVLSTSSGPVTWNGPDSRYRRFQDVPTSGYITVCNSDITAGQNVTCPDATSSPKSVITVGPAGSLTFTWKLPTAGCTSGITPCDNAPLTGTAALTAVYVYVKLAPIGDTETLTPSLTLEPTSTTTPFAASANYGDTVYVRLKAVNANGQSAYSDQQFKVITPPTSSTAPIPAPPTSVTIRLDITP